MKLIGITGYKQSGKDTLAEQLAKCHPSANIKRVNFADPLKEEVAKACGVTMSYIDQNKQQFRMLLQAWGTEFRRNLCGENYWTLKWLQKVNALSPIPDYLICTDARFLNEASVIKQCTGILIRVTRPGVTSDGHASETEQDKIITDFQINNDGNITDLYNKIKNLKL